jgi:hypothetical protein
MKVRLMQSRRPLMLAELADAMSLAPSRGI